MTFVVYSAQPSFPATDQNPNCVRYQVGQLWVDSDAGHAPVQADIDAILNPPLTTIDLAAITAALQPGNPQRAIMLLAMQRTNAIGTAINAINAKIGLAGNDVTPMTQQQLVALAQTLIR